MYACSLSLYIYESVKNCRGRCADSRVSSAVATRKAAARRASTMRPLDAMIGTLFFFSVQAGFAVASLLCVMDDEMAMQSKSEFIGRRGGWLASSSGGKDKIGGGAAYGVARLRLALPINQYGCPASVETCYGQFIAHVRRAPLVDLGSDKRARITGWKMDGIACINVARSGPRDRKSVV